MEKGEAGGGDDSTRAAVGMCDRFMTFLARMNLMNGRQKTTIIPRNGVNHQKNQAEEEEDDDDEFEVKIEKAEFELSGHHLEEDDERITATAIVLEEGNGAGATRTARESDEQKEAAAEAAAVAAAVVPRVEKKVRKSVTINEEANGGDKKKKKKSLLKKRKASSAAAASTSTGGQVGEEDPKPRWRLRPRTPSSLRAPSSNINDSKRRFSGAGDEPEK